MLLLPLSNIFSDMALMAIDGRLDSLSLVVSISASIFSASVFADLSLAIFSGVDCALSSSSFLMSLWISFRFCINRASLIDGLVNSMTCALRLGMLSKANRAK